MLIKKIDTNLSNFKKKLTIKLKNVSELQDIEKFKGSILTY